MKLIAATIALCLTAVPALAEEKTEGRHLAEISFESVDLNENGLLEIGEMQTQGQSVFTSMDYDDDGNLTEEEFLGWGFGFENIAIEQGKEVEYRTALRVVFNLWDSNADGNLTPSEHRRAGIADFARADVNNDAALDKQEFLLGFTVLVAIRTVLKPKN